MRKRIKRPRKPEEKYMVYDKTGKLKRLLKKSNEKTDISNEDWLNGVSCFVLNEKNEVLIEKRVGKGLTPGKLDLCSGHVNGAEISLVAMMRELREELGIGFEESLDTVKLTKTPAPLNFGSEEKNRNFFIDFFYLKRNNSKIKMQKKEVEDIMWVPLEECFELIRSGKTKFPNDYNYEEIFNRVREKCNGIKEIEEDYR